MDILVGIVVGFVLACALMQKPIKIQVHHKNETVPTAQDMLDLAELEDKMLNSDAKSDEKYDKFSEEFETTLKEVNNIMGGSDRDGQ